MKKSTLERQVAFLPTEHARSNSASSFVVLLFRFSLLQISLMPFLHEIQLWLDEQSEEKMHFQSERSHDKNDRRAHE